MKKTSLLLASAMIISVALTGCNNSSSSQSEQSDVSSEVTEPVSNEVFQPENAPELIFADNAVDFAANMKLGWNLGNTLDATGTFTIDSEASWGQPYVTRAQIDFVKECGFTSIRIPVSWSNHVDANNVIDEAWLNRVTEIVDYAVDAGFYIIINSHHDCDKYYPTEEHYEESEKYIKDIWTQLAEHFKNYDERLVFESMNEPRLSGTGKEWWFADNDPDGIESIEVISKLNQVFVDTIRAADGNNKERYLMVPSNAASPSNALNDAFTVPSDPSNKLIISVHAYSPYNFAMNGSGTKKWSEKLEGELGFMDQLNEKFIKNGYGVVIGEFGATNKNNLEDRVAWAKCYTEKAHSLKISCFLWDNGGIKSGEENFGMINRRDLWVYYPELLDELLAGFED